MDYAAVVVLEILYMIAFLALTSAGLAVVFGMMRVINLAHGEFVMVGGYTTIACFHAGLDICFSMLVVAPLKNSSLSPLPMSTRHPPTSPCPIVPLPRTVPSTLSLAH